MTLLIDAQGSLIKDDPWHLSDGAAKGDYSLVTAEFWCNLDEPQRQQQLVESPHLGLELKGEESWSQLGEGIDLLPQITLIVVIFAAFRDGRGYSLIRRGREELDFSGEIRAAGDILPEQIYFLKRCGATSFVIPDDDLAEVKQLISPFSYVYQQAADSQQIIAQKRNS